jgi:SecD/SecF fusion protein
MKRFTWRIVICLLPVVVGALIVAHSYNLYLNGQGGFKLGVDLAGGTDLIYEVDVNKFENGELPKNYDAQQLTKRLKERIDPADLYNIAIRPVSNTRVEIVLPTGGKHQAEAEERVWKDLLHQVAQKWPPKAYRVPVGQTIELLAQIDEQVQLRREQDSSAPAVPVTEIRKFIDDNYKPTSAPDEAAWNKLLAEAAKKWPPVGYDVGRGKIPSLVNRVRDQYPDEPIKATKYRVPAVQKDQLVARVVQDHPEVSAADVERYINDHSPTEANWDTVLEDVSRKWPPLGIQDFIDARYRTNKEKGYLTGEQVQTVKELISRVGSLEFRILANTTDDVAAIDAAKKFFVEAQKKPELKDELERLAVAGKPPPRPLGPGGKSEFPTATNIGQYSYSWVELGKTERQILGLSNQAGQNPVPGSLWKMAEDARQKGEAFVIPEGYNLGRSLLFSRVALNPRLVDKDANKKYEYFILTRDPEPGKEITGDLLDHAREDQSQTNFQLVVAFHFKSEGGARFLELTTKNKPSGSSDASFHRYLAVILDDKIESAPRLNQPISTDGIIEGNFKKEEVDRLVRILNAGALPASLKSTPVSESTIGATLGQDTINAGTRAVGLAFIAVIVFMLVYYRFSGLVACLALTANLILTVAFMALVNATFTLPGLAGLVLMLGMAVDANVLIYERLREERDRGATLALAIRNGYDRAFPTIIDTHLSSIFTAIVLYAVGNDQLKGFGISLTVGLVISLFTSLYMTRLMFDIWQYKGWLHKLSMLRLFTKPNIDFMAIRYYWFTATIILTVVGAAVFMYRLDKGGLNIDFVGGTAYGGQLTELASADELRGWLSKSDLPDLSVEQIFVSSPEFSEGDKTKFFTVRTSERDPRIVQTRINALLGDRLKKVELRSYKIDPNNKRVVLEFVDPVTKAPEFASRAQVSMLLSNELKSAGLESAAQQLVLEGLGKEREGHFQWMEAQFVQPLDRAKLEMALKRTQTEFATNPQPERLENFDSQLAQETQRRALYAILLSWAAILLYLWFRFGNWTFGMATVLCLIHDLFFTLGIIAFCHYMQAWWPGLASALLIQDFKIDLPTVAALLTLVGYSVNDTIVVFDRIREVRGKNPLLTPQMINDSVNQTLSRTLLTSFTVWLVVFVLYVWGGEGVHLFAFVMVVGVIVGTYSSIYIASPLLLIFGEGKVTSRQRQVVTSKEAALTS